VIRTDAAAPVNGETLAILRHDIFAIVTPARTDIEKIPNLAQKHSAFRKATSKASTSRPWTRFWRARYAIARQRELLPRETAPQPS
jgi:hypothetical protein